jgi:hypothetical protein
MRTMRVRRLLFVCGALLMGVDGFGAIVDSNVTDSTFDATLHGSVKFLDWGEHQGNLVISSGVWNLTVFEPLVPIGEDGLVLVQLKRENGSDDFLLSLGVRFAGSRVGTQPNYTFAYFEDAAGTETRERVWRPASGAWSTAATSVELLDVNEEADFELRIRAEPVFVPESSPILLAALLAVLMSLHTTWASRKPREAGARLKPLGWLIFGIVTTLSSFFALSQPTNSGQPSYKALFCFGASWTDTQHGPYWNGRYSNGPMWPEYLSTNLGLAYVPSNNFAVGGDSYSAVLWSQISPLTRFTNAESALFAFDSDANGWPFWNSTDSQWDFYNLDNLLSLSNSIVMLYSLGARSIVIPDMYGWGTAQPAALEYPLSSGDLANISSEIAGFNAALATVLDHIDTEYPDLRLFRLGFHNMLENLLLEYSSYGFAKATVDALGDDTLLDKSYTGPGANYCYWDDLHPTSKMHAIWANWYYEIVSRTVVERLDLVSAKDTVSLRMRKLKIGRRYTLQESLDLAHWIDLQTFTTNTGTNSWSVSERNASGTFFRMKWDD